MPWFKVDDNLAFHAKTVAAGNAAMGLWVRAGSWCAQQMTDGLVPHHIAAMLGTAPQAAKLVSSGLWNRHPDGFSFHEWDERQPKREQIEAKRAAAAERMKTVRAAKKSKVETEPQVRDSRSREQSRTDPDAFANPDPTRPDPTHTKTPTESLGTAAAAPPKRGTRIPDSFTITDAMDSWAKDNLPGFNVHDQLDEFIDYWRGVPGSKGVKLDWEATWRNGMRKRRDWLADRTNSPAQTASRRDGRGNNQWMY